jgi:hypothetical protein
MGPAQWHTAEHKLYVAFMHIASSSAVLASSVWSNKSCIRACGSHCSLPVSCSMFEIHLQAMTMSCAHIPANRMLRSSAAWLELAAVEYWAALLSAVQPTACATPRAGRPPQCAWPAFQQQQWLPV